MKLPLRTGRLLVRRFTVADVEAFAGYRSDPAVARYQLWDAPLPADRAAELVAGFAAGDPGAPGWFQYAVDRDGVLIGDIGVRLDDNLMQADLGFTLSRAAQGHGYATEAVSALLDALFTELRLHRVSAECDARNLRSAALLTRLGFTREGLRRRHTYLKGEWTDDLLFGLMAGEQGEREDAGRSGR